MSASDTDLEKQTRNHRPALIGIAVAVISVVIVFLALGFFGVDPEVDEATSAEPPIETAPLGGE